MYQPKETVHGGSTPPSTGSAIRTQPMAYKLMVDTSDIDRIAIGMRLYDMLSMSDTSSKVKEDDGQLYLTEHDINEMFRMVNNHIDLDVVVYRGE